MANSVDLDASDLVLHCARQTLIFIIWILCLQGQPYIEFILLSPFHHLGMINSDERHLNFLIIIIKHHAKSVNECIQFIHVALNCKQLVKVLLFPGPVLSIQTCWGGKRKWSWMWTMEARSMLPNQLPIQTHGNSGMSMPCIEYLPDNHSWLVYSGTVKLDLKNHHTQILHLIKDRS